MKNFHKRYKTELVMLSTEAYTADPKSRTPSSKPFFWTRSQLQFYWRYQDSGSFWCIFAVFQEVKYQSMPTSWATYKASPVRFQSAEDCFHFLDIATSVLSASMWIIIVCFVIRKLVELFLNRAITTFVWANYVDLKRAETTIQVTSRDGSGSSGHRRFRL